MSSLLSKITLVAATASFSLSAFAGDPMSAVGLWKTIDDETKKERVLIRITEAGGVLTGKIEKNIDPTIAADAKCDKCPDDDPRKNQLLLGMALIKDMKKDGDIYSGGTILSPGKGKVYKCELKVVDGGKKLDVKGKIAFLSSTQTWIRVE